MIFFICMCAFHAGFDMAVAALRGLVPPHAPLHDLCMWPRPHCVPLTGCFFDGHVVKNKSPRDTVEAISFVSIFFVYRSLSRILGCNPGLHCSPRNRLCRPAAPLGLTTVCGHLPNPNCTCTRPPRHCCRPTPCRSRRPPTVSPRRSRWRRTQPPAAAPLPPRLHQVPPHTSSVLAGRTREVLGQEYNTGDHRDSQADPRWCMVQRDDGDDPG